MSDRVATIVSWFQAIWLPYVLRQTFLFWKLSKTSGSGMGAALGQYFAQHAFKSYLARSILLTLAYAGLIYLAYLASR